MIYWNIGAIKKKLFFPSVCLNKCYKLLKLVRLIRFSCFFVSLSVSLSLSVNIFIICLHIMNKKKLCAFYNEFLMKAKPEDTYSAHTRFIKLKCNNKKK